MRLTKWIGWLSGVMMMASGWVAAREAMDRPNVVVIYLDDSGYGDYSHNGNPVIETPSISRLSQEGMNFTQFYVASPACSASRYSMLTGKYPARSGLGGWVIGPESKQHLSTQEITIAKGLKGKGYATGMFGKWHLGSPNAGNGMSEESLPLAHGFDRWVGTNVSHDYDVAELLASDPNGTEPVKGYKRLAKDLPSHEEVCNGLTGRYTKAAIEFIHENKDKPFFAYVAHNQPHLGLYASEKFKGKSRRGLLGDVMAEVDDSVGQIIKALEQDGIAKNTLVIFSSDNGPWILFQNAAKTKYGEARMHVGYAQPFRDGKGSNWEGGHRVPGLFYWPGVIDSTRQLEPASTLDILPTVFGICGVNVAHQVDGRDIRGILMPKLVKEPVKPFEFAYSGANNMPNAYRQGPWKMHIKLTSQLNDNYGFTASREKPLLFNVEQDLGERIDRAAEHPEIVAEMMKKLESIEQDLKKK